MEQKDAYIQYKNKVLFEILHANTGEIPSSDSESHSTHWYL